MIKAYKIVAQIIAGVVALQAAFITMSAFGIFGSLDSGSSLTEESVEDGLVAGAVGLNLHAIGADIILALSLVLLIMSFAVKNGAPTWALIVLVLAVIQYALGEVAGGQAWAGAVHGFLAFGLFGMAQVAARKAAKGPVEPPAQVSAA